MQTVTQKKDRKNVQVKTYGIIVLFTLLVTITLGNRALAGYGDTIRINLHNGSPNNPPAKVVVVSKGGSHFGTWAEYPRIGLSTQISGGGTEQITFNHDPGSYWDDKWGNFEIHVMYGHPLMDVVIGITHAENGPAQMTFGGSNIKSFESNGNWEGEGGNYELYLKNYDVVENGATMVVDFDNRGGSFEESVDRTLESRHLTTYAKTVITDLYAEAEGSGSFGGASASAKATAQHKTEEEQKAEAEEKRNYQTSQKHTYTIEAGHSKLVTINGSILKASDRNESFFLPRGNASNVIMDNVKDKHSLVGWYTMQPGMAVTLGLKTQPLQNSALSSLVKITGLR